jgi:hypothetical protein
MAGKAKYELPTESRRRLLHGFTFLYATRDRHFGNGRTARNSFERSVKKLANRLSGITEITRELLTTLQPEDIELAGVAEKFLDELTAESVHIRVTCPHTGKPMVIDDKLLGTEIKSEHCDQSFFVDWGSPVIVTENGETHTPGPQAAELVTSTEPVNTAEPNAGAKPDASAEPGESDAPALPM